MKKIFGLTTILVISILLFSGCTPSEDKQAKEILAEYFQGREAKLFIDDYEQTGIIEAKSIENKELIIVNDVATKNKLYRFEPTSTKKTNPVFLVDVSNKEVFQKILNTKQAGKPVYVKVAPLLEEDVVDSAFAKIEIETTPELKEEVTRQLENAQNELYDEPVSTSTATSDQTGTSQSGSGTASSSGTSSGTSSGSSNASGSTTEPVTNGTTDSGTTSPGTSNEGMPTSTLRFFQSLTPGTKVVAVTLNTDKPENYEVTYAGVTLTYSGDLGVYIGDLPANAAENLEPVKTKR